MNFNKSESWILRDDDKPFKVEVKHWVSEGGENRWNVYVYFFPKFPGFNELEEKFRASIPVSMNWGNTYYKWYRDKDGKIICKTYGSDYMHIHQEMFKNYSTSEEAFEVFEDARKNWEELNECLELSPMEEK